MRPGHISSWSFVALGLAFAAPALGEAEFTLLDPAIFSSASEFGLDFQRVDPRDVSADGRWVVGYASNQTEGTAEAFRWRPGPNPMPQSLGVLDTDYFESWAHTVNSDGSRIGVMSRFWGRVPSQWWPVYRERIGHAVWTEGSQELDQIPYIFADVTGLNAMSDDGRTVLLEVQDSASTLVWSADAGWPDDGYSTPQTLHAGQVARALGMTPDGETFVGSLSDGAETRPAIWVDGVPQAIDDLPGGDVDGVFRAISSDGTTLIGEGSTDTNDAAVFLWRAGEGTTVIEGDGVFEPFSAQDVSADGSIVLGYAFGNVQTEPFIWTESEGFRLLREVLEDDLGVGPPSYDYRLRVRMSDDGTVFVGNGFIDGAPLSFQARVPAPGVGAAAGIALMVGAGRRRRAA